MKRLVFRSVFALAIAAAMLWPMSAFAEEGGTPADDSGPHWSDVKDVAVWSMVGVAGGCALLGVLYLLKRKVGGFPEHPSWVAPISIMPAGELPSEDDPHGNPDGHGASHAAAH
jgi:hypothetical protein